MVGATTLVWRRGRGTWRLPRFIQSGAFVFTRRSERPPGGRRMSTPRRPPPNRRLAHSRIAQVAHRTHRTRRLLKPSN